MNKSKIIALLLMVTLVLGVLAFPLFLPDSPATSETSGAATTLSQTSAATTLSQTSAATTRTQKTHTTVARKNKTAQTTVHQLLVDENGNYYDLEHVVLYLEVYGRLPSNYITKSAAQQLGWRGGSLEEYKTGAAIGGDRFGNYEGLLPKNGQYTECDIDTKGKSRGAKRLVFSSDRHYYYTDDHYASFTEYEVVGGSVVKK